MATLSQIAEGFSSIREYIEEFVSQRAQDAGPVTVNEILDAHGLTLKQHHTYISTCLKTSVERGNLTRSVRVNSGRSRTYQYAGA